MPPPLDPLRDTDASKLGAPGRSAGDFYCTDEHVTRGVSIPAGPHEYLGGITGELWRGGLGESYCESDNITRGVSMATEALHGGAITGGWAGVGDLYCLPEDTRRGVSMASDQVGFGDIYGSFDFAEPDQLLKSAPVGMGAFACSVFTSGVDDEKTMDGICGSSLDSQDPLAKSIGSGMECHHSILNDTVRFPEMQSPPPLPTDPFFALEEATALRLSLSHKFRPFKIGNDLLDFLEDSVAAVILKVNQAKFTVKANVFIGSRMCTIKARVYHTSGSEYVLEMQRRSGDAVVFGTVFQKAAKYFDERLYFGSAPPAAVNGPLATVMPTVTPTDKMELQPMLDMAGMEELPSLQAEAAAALVEFAVSQPFAAFSLLCCQEASGRIRQLLKSDRQDVAYPTAQLLSQLAKMSAAGPFITDDSFVHVLVEKMCSKQSSLLVKTELTNLVSTLVQQHADKLSSRAKDSITAALGKATGPGPSSSKLRSESQRSAISLVGSMVGGTVF